MGMKPKQRQVIVRCMVNGTWSYLVQHYSGTPIFDWRSVATANGFETADAAFTAGLVAFREIEEKERQRMETKGVT